ncbi:hypothetical protein U724_26830 [Pseudomonas chlororaphis subsp. aurantiaca PB-St2]|nr:hypothetical protein U724_26830 [Pseudomonas chlororaphis subsp. aurantiaca PB-St2]
MFFSLCMTLVGASLLVMATDQAQRLAQAQ